MENENQAVEATNSTDDVDVETKPTDETVVEAPPTKTYSEEEFKKVVARAKKAEAEAKAAKSQPPVVKTNLDVSDLIEISASLGGLDVREQEYLASQHKLTGQPLKDIKSSEDFLLWQSAYRAKVEKEKSSLPPSNRQPETPEPKTLEQRLAEVTDINEKEKIMIEAGLIIPQRHRNDGNRVTIGR